MTQVLRFDRAIDSGSLPRPDRRGLEIVHRPEPEPDDFWPEVSRGLWGNQPIAVNPANAPRRVLSEMLLILGGAGLLVVLTTIFLGAPTP